MIRQGGTSSISTTTWMSDKKLHYNSVKFSSVILALVLAFLLTKYILTNRYRLQSFVNKRCPPLQTAVFRLIIPVALALAIAQSIAPPASQRAT